MPTLARATFAWVIGMGSVCGWVVVASCGGGGNAPAPLPDAGARDVEVAPPVDGAAMDAGADADAAAVGACGTDISTLAQRVETAFCETYQACCNAADAGTGFNVAACANARDVNYGGFAFLSRHNAALRVPNTAGCADASTMNNPRIRYDEASAEACVTLARSYTCDISAENYQRLRDLCFAAYVGQQKQGDPCTDNLECATGLRCSGGTCAALAAMGNPCVSSEDCAYRGTSMPNLYCDSVDGMEAGVCQTRLGADAGCGTVLDYESQCASGVCDDQTTRCAAAFTQLAYCGMQQ